MQAPHHPNYAVNKHSTVLPVAELVEQRLATVKDFPQRQSLPDVVVGPMVQRVMEVAAKVHGGK